MIRNHCVLQARPGRIDSLLLFKQWRREPRYWACQLHDRLLGQLREPILCLCTPGQDRERETARAVVSELNAIRIKAEAFGLWHFVRQSQSQPLYYAVCAAPSNGAQRWIPTGPLDLPPCVVKQGETFEAAIAAVRDGNDRIWEVTSSPKVWHTMALLLTVPVLNVPAAVPAEVPAAETEPTALAATTL